MPFLTTLGCEKVRRPSYITAVGVWCLLGYEKWRQQVMKEQRRTWLDACRYAAYFCLHTFLAWPGCLPRRKLTEIGDKWEFNFFRFSHSQLRASSIFVNILCVWLVSGYALAMPTKVTLIACKLIKAAVIDWICINDNRFLKSGKAIVKNEEMVPKNFRVIVNIWHLCICGKNEFAKSYRYHRIFFFFNL